MSERKAVGYVASNREKTGVIYQGDGCVVAGSKRKMGEYLQEYTTEKDGAIVKKACFGDVTNVLSLGGAYLFDGESFSRFLSLAKKCGLDVRVADQKSQYPGGKDKFFRVEIR